MTYLRSMLCKTFDIFISGADAIPNGIQLNPSEDVHLQKPFSVCVPVLLIFGDFKSIVEKILISKKSQNYIYFVEVDNYPY